MVDGSLAGRIGTILCGLLVSYAACGAPHTHKDAAPVLDQETALARSQAAIGITLADHRFVDQSGREVGLKDFRGKPLVISLIYTSCYHTCPTMTMQLAAAVDIAREALGEASFSVLTVGFDTENDNPDRMRMFAKERGIRVPYWAFVSADAETIRGFTEQLGFTYMRSPRGFDHLTQTTIVDAEGVIYHQVYGETIDAPRFVEPLKQLVWGTEAKASTLSGWITGVRLFCTVYDPTTGRYTFDYSIFVAAIIGGLSLGSVGVFLVRSWRQSKRPYRA
jgi:protein SCO1/2